jgi:Zn-dependent M28 family amino/carboxypeptidase
MSRIRVLACIALMAACGALALGAAPAPPEEDLLRAWRGIEGAAIAEHVRVLASDEYEGRAPGTRGETLTLAYVAAAFERAGLVPAGDAGYAQGVPLVETTIQGSPRLTLRVGKERLTPALREEFVPRLGQPAPRVTIERSPLVFAGHGAVAPEYGWNDYEGVDLTGKTVILLFGDPGTASGDTSIFAGSTGTRHAVPSAKAMEAARRGARAAIVVHTDSSSGFPWATIGGGGLGASQHFLAPEKEQPAFEATVIISEPTARALFRAAGLDFDAEAQAARTRGFRAKPISGTLDLSLEAKVRSITSHNLVGIVPGSGAPDEAVVLMAHWDHMGRDSTRKGDAIFNGAVDNATGVGALIEIARAFQRMKRAPRRTVAFVATTAEERGLLGSEYLARHPVRPLGKTAAAVAIDALFPYGAYERMSVTGFGNSELEETLAAAAARLGRKLQDDGAPQLGAFYRADNYPFAKRGVPGFLAVGGPDNAGLPRDSTVNASLMAYGQTKYHQPADEYEPATWDMAGIEGDARTLFEFAWRVANDARFPNWRWNSPFRALGDARR